MTKRTKILVGLSVPFCLITAIGSYAYLIRDILWSHNVPLYTASQKGDWKQVKTLLAHGADPNDTTDLQNDRTALFWAAYQGRVDMVELLIENGINVNKVDTHGETALDYAGGVGRGDASGVVRLLKQAGAKKGADL